MEKRTLLTLKERAAKIRMHSVDAVYGAKSGHPGGSLSIADVITYLYFHKMNIDPKNPQKEDRDRFVLSKGSIPHWQKRDISTLKNLRSFVN